MLPKKTISVTRGVSSCYGSILVIPAEARHRCSASRRRGDPWNFQQLLLLLLIQNIMMMKNEIDDDNNNIIYLIIVLIININISRHYSS